jgi:hypothetical protein
MSFQDKVSETMRNVLEKDEYKKPIQSLQERAKVGTMEKIFSKIQNQPSQEIEER